jgi:alpha-L-rhamnosidase
MQFPMDTRLQALFTYAVSADARLARKALIDFHHSMTPEGLIQGKYPCNSMQIISTFSLHYIFMLQEYHHQTGDLEILRVLGPDVETILSYYDRKVGPDGLVHSLGYWPFIDWQEAWAEGFGTPNPETSGSVTIIDLMYAHALDRAAKIYHALGRDGSAEEYLTRKSRILSSVKRLCWDEGKGLFRDAPDLPRYSLHAQSWAVLDGLATGEDGAGLMRRALSDPDVVACSFAASFELHRALETVGLFDEIESDLQRWTDLVARGCTTCPETPGLARSECHAWSALPMFEMVRVMAGIRNPDPGWTRVVVEPHLGRSTDLCGTTATPKGSIRFQYDRSGGALRYEVALPEGMSGVFRAPDGTESALVSGMNRGGDS